MPACHPLPRCWLFTDARLADHGIAAARALPPRSGIVVRSDALSVRNRHRLFRRLRAIARARKHRLLLAAGDPALAQRLGADGVHLRRRSAVRAAQARRLGLLTSAPVHTPAEARAARHGGIAICFVSPLHPTRSHVGVAALPLRRWLWIARLAGGAPVALGGMTGTRHRRLLLRAHALPATPAWAAIDAWESRAVARRQKRNCVPT
jgi:thiamine-phosphate pyrophosphorylase